MSAPTIRLTLSVDAANLVLMGLQQLLQSTIADIQAQAKASIDDFQAAQVAQAAPDVVEHEGASL